MAKSSPEFEKLKPMVNKIMQENGGWDTIKSILDGDEDPTRAIGMFLAQLVMQLGEMFMQKGAEVPVSVMLEDGGLVEWVLDQIEIHFDMPKEFSDEIFLDVVDIIKAAAEDPGAAQGAPQEEAPPPQGGGLQAMGGQSPMGGM